jgi:CMP-N-acetylneuraminic acid synthetase
MKVIAIIMARAGSKGLPGKNLLPLAGKPLLAHSIEHARASGVCDVVLVTTEDERIAQVARQYGAEVPFKRPPELSDDETPTGPVIQHALTTYEAMTKQKMDIVVYLQPTDIFRTPEMIRECVERLKNNPELDSAFVAYRTHKNYWRKSADGGWERLAPDLATYESRQFRKEYLYREDTGIASASRSYLAREGKRLGPKVDLVVTDDPKTAIDIHTALDFWLAEKILTEWKGG